MTSFLSYPFLSVILSFLNLSNRWRCIMRDQVSAFGLSRGRYTSDLWDLWDFYLLKYCGDDDRWTKRSPPTADVQSRTSEVSEESVISLQVYEIRDRD